MNSNASATAARKHRNPNQAFTAFIPSTNAPRWRTLVSDPIHKRPQLQRATRMVQLPQRLGFDLAGDCSALAPPIVAISRPMDENY